jgi:hypothetical protein
MKQYEYTVKISKPCSESWASMTDSGKGRYCSHCTKNVVDFTQLTDNEILQLVENATGKLCGRFNQEQLNRCLIQTGKKSVNPQLYKILAGLLLLSSAENSIAHEEKSATSIVAQPVNDNLVMPEIMHKESKNEFQSDSLKNTVRGKIIDAITKEPLPFVNIRIIDSQVGTLTDVDGNFKITIPDSLLKDQIRFLAVFLGYDKTYFTVDLKNLSGTNEVLLIPANQVIMGDMVIEKAHRKWWKRKKKKCAEEI